MPIYKFTWKDPDYDRHPSDELALPEDVQRKLQRAGIGEYITVSYDSDTDQAVVLRPRKR